MIVTGLKYRITVRFVQIQVIMKTEDMPLTALTDLILSQKQKRFEFSVSHSEANATLHNSGEKRKKKKVKDSHSGQIRFKMRLWLVKCVPSSS